MPRDRLDVLGLWKGALGGALQRPCDGMLRASLGAGGKAQHLGLGEARGGDAADQLGTAFGQRAGLVEGDDADAFQPLQRVPLAEEHTQFGRPPGAHHDRGWRGEPHGAGAGHDQHRDPGDQRVGEGGGGAEDEPGQEGQRSHGHDRGHEPDHHLVGERLDRQLGPLRLFDHGDDPRQHGVCADSRRPEAECARAVDRAANDGGAFGFLDGHRFAGDHAFIDVGAPGEHLAIDCDALAGADMQHIAQRHLGNWQLGDLAAALDPRGRGFQPDQPLDRRPGAALRPCLEESTEQDQRDNDRRGLEIDRPRALGQQPGQEERDGGIEPGRQRAERDQRIHVRSALEQQW